MKNFLYKTHAVCEARSKALLPIIMHVVVVGLLVDEVVVAAQSIWLWWRSQSDLRKAVTRRADSACHRFAKV